MKKLVVLLLVLAMVFSMVACASDTNTPADTGDEAQTETTDTNTETTDTETSEPAAEDNATASDVDTSIIPSGVTLSDSKALEGKKLGCSIVYKGDEWCAALATALETLGKYYGADITVEDGDLNDETQTKQIENMLASNCDMILVDPVTPDGSSQALNQAYDADIPIIIYDGYWSEGDEKALTTVTWDQVGTGTLVGEYFVNYVKENMDGKARVIELTNAVSTHCQERFVGLHEVIDAANADGCEIEVLNKYDSQGNRETAYNAIAALVEPYDFIISDVDNGAMGACSALQAAGNTDVKVLSMGAYGEEPFSALYNNDPNYLACLNVDPWVLAESIFEAAIGYYEGTEVPTKTNIDLYVVDNSNVTDYWTFE